MGNENLSARIANLSPAKLDLLQRRLQEKQLESPDLKTIARRANREFAPLSFAQQRLWFLNQWEPESPAYNESRAVRLSGVLDVGALEKSLNQIISRHEVLRTTIVSVDGNPVQRIADRRTIEVPLRDLRGRPAQDREIEVRRLIDEAIRLPFDLANDLMLRVLLLRVEEEQHVLVLVKHHVASDGWSSGIFWQELAALYEASTSGRSPTLRELPVQYADYAAWQRDWFRGEVLETQVSYWRKQLDNIATLQLPTDRPRPAVQSFRGAQQAFILTRNLSGALKALSLRQGVTLFMTLLAAFQALLYRYTGQEDIAVGAPIAGRNRIETEELIGFFVNTLVLRIAVSGKQTFKELLESARRMCLEAYSHQDLPFEKLVEELQPQRVLNHNPLFQVTFQLNNLPRQLIKLSAIEVEDIALDSGISKFDLSLSMTDRGEDISGRLQYNTDLFDQATMARMLDHFKVLLESIAADPDRPIYDLEILTAAEKQQLLIGWNATENPYRADKCIHEIFEAQVERTPEAVAVVFEHQEWSYRVLNARANRIARYLRKLAVKPGVVVGVCIERSFEMLAAILGILKSGGTYLPLDTAYPEQRLTFMLDDAQALVLLTEERMIGSLPQHSADVVLLDRDWEKIASESDQNLKNTADSEDLAYVIYTSGSTGKPKGVMISHGSIASHCASVRSYYELNDNDRVLQFTSFNFDASLEQILPTLISGARLVLRGSEVPTPAALHKAIYDLELSVIDLTTSYWHQLARTIATAPESVAPSRLRLVIVAGEEMLPETVKLWQQSPHQSVRLLNAYGPTEATITATAFTVSPGSANNLLSRTVPIGRPLGNRVLFVLDKHGKPVPIGVPGELHIGGAGLARGYLDRPELTAEKFIPDPFSDKPGARLYKTGDLVRYLPNGEVEFLERMDQQVKIRGFRIELAEIEAVLSEHPEVFQSVVVAREEAPGDKRLVAYVVVTAGATTTAHELRAFLKAKLPEYMVPSVFTFLEALPLSPNGKVDRKALPAPDQMRSKETFLAPRTPIEESLASIWADVLNLDKIGIHDNFFELGGHSLKATQVISRVREALRLDLSVRVLFEAPTVAELASRVEQNTPGIGEFEELARSLAEVESLSDVETERQLDGKRATESGKTMPQENSSMAEEAASE